MWVHFCWEQPLQYRLSDELEHDLGYTAGDRALAAFQISSNGIWTLGALGVSLDWFKEKMQEPPISNGKNHGFLQIFP